MSPLSGDFCFKRFTDQRDKIASEVTSPKFGILFTIFVYILIIWLVNTFIVILCMLPIGWMDVRKMFQMRISIICARMNILFRKVLHEYHFQYKHL